MDLGPELNQFLFLLRKKRRRQQRHDILLSIILNKEKEECIIEAIEKAIRFFKTKEELIEWINKNEWKQ